MSDSRSRDQLGIRDAMVLVAGVAVGLWLFHEDISAADLLADPDDEDWIMLAVSTLGGISLAGTPILIMDRIRARHRWRSGALNWFALGLACWGLAPALALDQLEVVTDGTTASACFVYTLPLMGLFLLAALLVAGRPVRRWWTCRGWWPEWFGMWVLCGWAATGSYILFIIYWEMFT